MPRGCPHYRCRRRSPGCTCRPLAPPPLSLMNYWTHSLPSLLFIICRSCHSDMGIYWVLWVSYLFSALPLVPQPSGRAVCPLYWYTTFFPYLHNSTSPSANPTHSIATDAGRHDSLTRYPLPKPQNLIFPLDSEIWELPIV